MEHLVPPLTAKSCLFLDVDGTLIEFSPSPRQTIASDELRELLLEVSSRLSGALALVSGRRVSDLDMIFSPARLPAAGIHGGEFRAASGFWPQSVSSDLRLDGLRAELEGFARRYVGIEIEDKGVSLAAHYRGLPTAKPELEALIASSLAALGTPFHALHGNMVIEIKPQAFSKANAIRALLQETPFAGRNPTFVGDDITDIDGFRYVESCGGTSVAVGERVTAQYFLRDPLAVRDWLQEFTAT